MLPLFRLGGAHVGMRARLQRGGGEEEEGGRDREEGKEEGKAEESF